MDQVRPLFSAATVFFQQLSLVLIASCAIGAFSLTALAAFGVIPWVEIPITYGGAPVAEAGMLAQIAVTVFLISMCFLIPTNRRVMKLEHAHHAFSIRMEDVAHAYRIAHSEDRKGLFHCTSEFDAVKERIKFLHAHPDLSSLEPDILEVAAQMSRVSQDLAEAFSNERVDRAYGFLKQRQEEIEAFQQRLAHAKAIQLEITRLAGQLELDEAVAQSQLRNLIDDLWEVMPEVHEDHNEASSDTGVVPIHKIAER